MLMGLRAQTVVGETVSFFTNEAFLKAKEVLHSELAISSRLIKCQKDDDNTLDLYKWFGYSG